MSRPAFLNTRGIAGSTLLLATVLVTGGGLAAWKVAALRGAEEAAANQPEPVESISAAVARAGRRCPAGHLSSCSRRGRAWVRAGPIDRWARAFLG